MQRGRLRRRVGDLINAAMLDQGTYQSIVPATCLQESICIEALSLNIPAVNYLHINSNLVFVLVIGLATVQVGCSQKLSPEAEIADCSLTPNAAGRTENLSTSLH